MVNNDLLFLSKNDIPFIGGHINIHNPAIREIAYIGEEAFHIGVRFLALNKDDLILEDKNDLENQSNFNIFMSVMNSRENTKHKTDSLMVLTLMFPNVKFKIEKERILFQKENNSIESSINELNFNDFQDIVRKMFCLDVAESGGQNQYNPADALAKKIAEKLQKGKQKAAEENENRKVNIFSRYISILSVGEQKDMNELLNYTVYQLFDEFKRYRLKQDFDIYVQAKMAGASDLEEVKNWMDDIHS